MCAEPAWSADSQRDVFSSLTIIKNFIFFKRCERSFVNGPAIVNY